MSVESIEVSPYVTDERHPFVAIRLPDSDEGSRVRLIGVDVARSLAAAIMHCATSAEYESAVIETLHAGGNQHTAQQAIETIRHIIHDKKLVNG